MSKRKWLGVSMVAGFFAVFVVWTALAPTAGVEIQREVVRDTSPMDACTTTALERRLAVQSSRLQTHKAVCRDAGPVILRDVGCVHTVIDYGKCRVCGDPGTPNEYCEPITFGMVE